MTGFENTGAGNQEVNGTYHLNFVSFYPATVKLPVQANMTSFLEVKCDIEKDSHNHIELSRTPHTYVYDVWFEIENINGTTITIGEARQALLQKLNDAKDDIGYLYANKTITYQELPISAWAIDEN